MSGVSFGDLDWEKKLGEKIGGTSIAELAEMSGLSWRELRHAKDMATRTKIKYRAAYGRHAEDYPLQTIVVATTNDRHMLTDTEHRRTPVTEVPDGRKSTSNGCARTLNKCGLRSCTSTTPGDTKNTAEKPP